MGDLVEDLSAAFAKARIPLKGDRKTSVFRIHRDVRFAKDKSPYKTNVGAVLTRGGGKNDPGCFTFTVATTAASPRPASTTPSRMSSRACAPRSCARPRRGKAMTAKLAEAGLTLSDGICDEARAARLRGRRRSRDRRRAAAEDRSAVRPIADAASRARRWSTTSAPSPGTRCRCSNGAGRAHRFALASP